MICLELTLQHLDLFLGESGTGRDFFHLWTEFIMHHPGAHEISIVVGTVSRVEVIELLLRMDRVGRVWHRLVVHLRLILRRNGERFL